MKHVKNLRVGTLVATLFVLFLWQQTAVAQDLVESGKSATCVGQSKPELVIRVIRQLRVWASESIDYPPTKKHRGQ